MQAPRRPDLADPEFDPAPAAPVRLRDFDPAEHHRLVVNPFLAVFLLLAWWRAARWLLFQGPFPPLAVPSVVALGFLPHAVQYHCLDCGRTGSYPSRLRHACPAIVARWEQRRRSRFPVPSARTQLVIWGYVVVSALLLLAVAGGR